MRLCLQFRIEGKRVLKRHTFFLSPEPVKRSRAASLCSDFFLASLSRSNAARLSSAFFSIRALNASSVSAPSAVSPLSGSTPSAFEDASFAIFSVVGSTALGVPE